MRLRSMRFARPVVVVTAALLAGVLAACSAPQGPGRDVAMRFVAAVESSDWSTACTLLAPSTKADLEQSAGRPCAAALEQEGLPDTGAVGGFQAFGTMAQVRYASDTLFLAEFKDGWRVLAAGCTRVVGHPYDCRLEG